MADNTPPENIPAKKKLFDFNARIVKSGAAETLKVDVEIDVRNISTTDAWNAPLFIEFKFSSELVAPPVWQAAQDARINEEPKNMAALGGGVHVPEGWSVWAINEPNDHVVVVRVFNNIDQQTGTTAETTTAFAAGATLTIRFPLVPTAASKQFTLDYGYQTGRGKDTRVDGSLELTPSELGEWRPQVSLKCDHRNSTLIEPGRQVKISWSINGALSATLRGPLPGGNSELTLSRDPKSNFKMEEGWLTILAVGPATYILDAEVQGPEGKPNVQVIRTLTIDIFSPDKYASLRVRPGSVLPNGQVEIVWAVWGVAKAAIKVGKRLSLKLNLTEQNLSRWYQGAGVWRVNARAISDAPENVRLYITTDIDRSEDEKDSEKTWWKDAIIDATPWEAIVDKPVFNGKPLALAVAGGHMALLTSDGLYTAPVGMTDEELKDPVFTKSKVQGKAWHALAAFGRDFVVLRQTDGDDIVLERYDAKGQRIKLPITLHNDFQTLARRNGAVFDFVGFGNRIHVVVEAPVSGRWARSAYSVRLEPDEHVRPEGLLASLAHYHLVTCAGALYAYHRGTGRMLRFGLTKTGELEPPTRAASAVNSEGMSMVKTGLLTRVGSVLAVLDPAALPSLDPLADFCLTNIVDYAVKKLAPTRKANEIPQDLVYNPQKDRWAACGHGLKIQAGAIAAYRGGDSERLWVLQPTGEMHKLTDAGERLFAPDFIDEFPSKPLPPALDATREFRFTNLTGFELVPVDEFCRASGVEGFSSEGVAELTPLPNNISNLRNMDFKLSYNSTDTTSATLRFMVANPPGSRYLIETTFSGSGLGTVTSVFTRLTTDGRLDEVPDTSQTHPAGQNNLLVKQSQRLHDKTRLLLHNGTPGELRLSPTIGPVNFNETGIIEVTLATPDFKIFIPNVEKAGHVSVTFDFAQPMGIELSPRNQVQHSLIRIVKSDANRLEPTADFLGRIASIVYTFEKYDGSRSERMPQPHDAYWCRIGVKKKLELDGVRIGDGVATRDGQSIFVTLARPEDVKKIRIMKIDTGSFETSELAADTPGGVFSMPNAIAVSDRYYYAMFGEPSYHQSTFKFEFPFKRSLESYKEFVALAASTGGNIYLVAKGEKRVGYEKLPAYTLVTLRYPENDISEIPLDQIGFPVGIPPLAVSPDGKTVALCDSGGLLVIDVPNKKVQTVRPGLRSPASVAFSNDGQWIYCLHMTSAFAVNPRRAVNGRDISLTRIHMSRLNQAQGIGLPNVESNFSITGNTRQSFRVNESSKEQAALTLVVSPDDRYLFVSAGTSIMRIAIDSFTLQPWRASVELPCRLITVKKAGANAYTVYALGSTYVGDGTKVDEYKTHLYAIPAPAN